MYNFEWLPLLSFSCMLLWNSKIILFCVQLVHLTAETLLPHILGTTFRVKALQVQFKTLCKTLWNEKNKQWLVSLWLIWHLFSRSALYHTEPAAPCLFPSCRRRWRSCICTKTKAGSQTEHSFPHMDKAQTQTHFLDKAVSDSCWTDTIYWPLILEGQQRTHLCFKHGCVMFFIWSLSLLFYWLSG